MTRIRSVAWGVLTFLAVPSVVQADPTSVSSNAVPWIYFYDPSAAINQYFKQVSLGQPTMPGSVDGGTGGNAVGSMALSGVTVALPVNANVTVTTTSTNTGTTTTTSNAGGGTTPPSGSNASQPADALINFDTTGKSPEASSLTVGTAQPWYLSPAVTSAFGHTPSAAEQGAFTSEVLNDVKQTFSLAHLYPNITLDPTVTANHTLSVVSGLSYAPNTSAIGITDVGHNGFGFLDKLSYATNTDDLAMAVAHNVSHELMHAFGVAVHADQTGQFIDSATATWGLLKDPNATFSPAAAALISSTNFGPVSTSTASVNKGEMIVDGDQELLAVPEPTTLAAWSVVVTALLYRRHRKAIRPAA